MNGLDILISAIFIIGGCVIGYYWGASDGRKAERAEREAEVTALHADAARFRPAGRKCSVCGGPLKKDGDAWVHVVGGAYLYRDHFPTPNVAP
jgi:hypothetical protein